MTTVFVEQPLDKSVGLLITCDQIFQKIFRKVNHLRILSSSLNGNSFQTNLFIKPLPRHVHMEMSINHPITQSPSIQSPVCLFEPVLYCTTLCTLGRGGEGVTHRAHCTVLWILHCSVNTALYWPHCNALCTGHCTVFCTLLIAVILQTA